METLIAFLKSCSALDLLILIFIFLSAVVLVPAGIWISIASRTRKPIFFFLIAALFPLLLALLGTFLRIRNAERVAAMFSEASAEVVAAARDEAWITTYIGAAETALLGLIGVTGLILKKNEKA